MPPTERSYQALTAAVAFLTAELERHELAEDILLEYVKDDDLTDPELVLGALQLALILLVKLEKAGHNPAEVLQDVVRRYQPPTE